MPSKPLRWGVKKRPDFDANPGWFGKRLAEASFSIAHFHYLCSSFFWFV
jgi:hypothetical protein